VGQTRDGDCLRTGRKGRMGAGERGRGHGETEKPPENKVRH
jgi:hypothetical protein